MPADAASPAKPEWDVSSDEGRARMAAWLDDMIGVVPHGMDALLAASMKDDLRPFMVHVLPPAHLIERLASGKANEVEQALAAELLAGFVFPQKSGRKPLPKHQRYPYLFMVAQEARRISDLWRKHYRRTDLGQAVALARARCLADIENPDVRRQAEEEASEGNVKDTLRRARSQNFGA